MHHGTISKPIADGLLELRSRIEKGGIPSSKFDETLNLATWNVREFGKEACGAKRRGHVLHLPSLAQLSWL